MPIYLVRHGETPLNVARVLQPPDTPLNARGLAQAEALARRLAPLAVAAIVSSDMPRALATAEAIARATRAPLHTEPLLQERHFGALRGLAYDTLGYDALAMEDAPPGGESGPAFRDRVGRAFERVVALRASLDGALVVVTHGLVIRALIGRLQGGAGSGCTAGPVGPVGNTALTVLSAAPPHAVELLGCIAHLDAAAADAAANLTGG